MSKIEAWDYALGMIKIDGLEPSAEYLELVEKEKRGELTREDIKKILDTKYRMKGRLIQDRLFQSDFDKQLKILEEQAGIYSDE